MKGSITLTELAAIVKKRWLLIATITKLATTISGVLAYYILTPIYSSSIQIIVNHSQRDKEENFKYDEIQANLQLINTYIGILESSVVLDRVIKELDLSETVDQLKKEITISNDKDSELIWITVENKNGETAYNATNKIVEVFQQEIGKIMKIDNVSVMSNSLIPTKPVKPNKILLIVEASIGGIILGLILAIALEYNGDFVKNEEDIPSELPILGTISRIKENYKLILNKTSEKGHRKKKKSVVLITNSVLKSIISEQYRAIRTNIQFSSRNKNPQIIVCTSARPTEGKSTTISNLAITVAQQGRKVLLIDGDMRKPVISETFRVDNIVGLSNILEHQIKWSEVIKESEVPNLFLITSGPTPSNPSELIGSKNMGNLLLEIRDQFDVILIDTPPVLVVSDTTILAQKCDGTIIVVKNKQTDKKDIKKTKEVLEQVQTPILGVVLNYCEVNKKDYSYYN